jgi:hypothetical protein
LLDELAARGGLHAALAGRDAASLLPLLRHLSKHITDPRHSASLSGVAARVLDLYAPVVHTDERVSYGAVVLWALPGMLSICCCGFGDLQHQLAARRVSLHIRILKCSSMQHQP